MTAAKLQGSNLPGNPRASHTHFDKLSLSKIQESQYNEAQILSLFSETDFVVHGAQHLYYSASLLAG